ncbi:MAG TPA: response regulator [Aggregatilineales bacterium]|nr:response regulator [Aggregatilineales bacterium]
MSEGVLPAKPPTALVIDDNVDACRITKMALESIGYEVTTFEDSSEGLEFLNWMTFDLMILDLMMPKIDGATILRQVREMPLHRSLRVIVLSANVRVASSQITELANYVLYKPIDVPSFVKLAQRLKEQPEDEAKPEKAGGI